MEVDEGYLQELEPRRVSSLASLANLVILQRFSCFFFYSFVCFLGVFSRPRGQSPAPKGSAKSRSRRPKKDSQTRPGVE